METRTTSLQVLEVLYIFIWLRECEIQEMLSDKAPGTIKNAIYELKKLGAIRDFSLPEHFGLGYTLTQVGYISIGSCLGFPEKFPSHLKRKSKLIYDENEYVPCHWLHHLLSVNALIAYSKSVSPDDLVEIVGEHQIRRDYPKLAKVPDGLLVLKSGYIWFEIENLRKIGNNLLNLAETLVAYNHSNLIRLYDRECVKFVVGYRKNHYFTIEDIRQKILEVANCRVNFTILPIEVDLTKIKPESPRELCFEATGTDLLYNILNQAIFRNDGNWYDATPGRVLLIKGFIVVYKSSGKKQYSWQFSDNKLPHAVLAYGESDSLERCKRDFCKKLYDDFLGDQPLTRKDIIVDMFKSQNF